MDLVQIIMPQSLIVNKLGISQLPPEENSMLQKPYNFVLAQRIKFLEMQQA